MFSIQDIVDIAVQIEQNAERFYRQAADEAASAALQSLLVYLADQEVEHGEWLAKLKPAAAAATADPRLEQMARNLLQAAVGDQRFALADTDMARLRGIEALLALAIEFEEDTILFYKLLQPFIADPVDLEGLQAIIAEEERHCRLLRDFMDNGTQSGWQKR